MSVSPYSQLEMDILDAASNAMISRYPVLGDLRKFVEPSGGGVENWFQCEFILSPWSRKWDFQKAQSPADLIISNKLNGEIKVELKGVTGTDFKGVVLDWYFPQVTTQKSKQQCARDRALRKNIPIVFLSFADAYYNSIIGKRYFPPIVKKVHEDWVVGIIKRRS